MPVSRNDIKRKRRECDTIVDCLPDSPKRTKVHAQRKFAQGSALCNSIISTTPIKEIEKPKPVDVTPTELLPSKRPNTEDFLTFLCFRGTSILPPTLDFFNAASHTDYVEENSKDDSIDRSEAESEKPSNQPPGRPFVAFGVRKRADPYPDSKMDRKRRHAMTVQALRRKYQDQRLAKLRAIAANKVGITVPVNSTKMSTRTRSSLREVPKAAAVPKKNVMMTKHKIIVKRKMRLRSGGRIIRTEIVIPKKHTVRGSKKVVKKSEKIENSSEFSSEDDQPLVKTVTKLKPVKGLQLRVARKTATVIPKHTAQKKSSVILKRKTVVSQRKTRSNSILKPVSSSQRPTRKTKEAAALYMELLGRKLVNEAEIDDDTLSIDSFPELPNVRKAEQRENEFKAQSKSACRMSTRSSIDNVNVAKSSRGDSKEKSITETKQKNKTGSVIKTKAMDGKIHADSSKSKDIKSVKNIVKNKGTEAKKESLRQQTITTRTKSIEIVKEQMNKDSLKKEKSNIKSKNIEEKPKAKDSKEHNKNESRGVKDKEKDKNPVIVRHTRQSMPKLSDSPKVDKIEVKDKTDKANSKKVAQTVKNKSNSKTIDKSDTSSPKNDSSFNKSDKSVLKDDKSVSKNESKAVGRFNVTKTEKKGTSQDKALSKAEKTILKGDKTLKSDRVTAKPERVESKAENALNKSSTTPKVGVDVKTNKSEKNVNKTDSSCNKVEQNVNKTDKSIKSDSGSVKTEKDVKDSSLNKSEKNILKTATKVDKSIKIDVSSSKIEKNANKSDSGLHKSDFVIKPDETNKTLKSSPKAEGLPMKSDKLNAKNALLKCDKVSKQEKKATGVHNTTTVTLKSEHGLDLKGKGESKQNISILEQSFSDSDEEPLASKIKFETETVKTQTYLAAIKSKVKNLPLNLSSTEKTKTPVLAPKPTVLVSKSLVVPTKSGSTGKSSISSVKSESVTQSTTSTAKSTIASLDKSLVVSSVDSMKIDVKKTTDKVDASFPLSDDDDEKVFRGFVKTESHGSKKPCVASHQNATCHAESIDIKDIGRRFGKGKVNMSNEQIEKWLNDADQELKRESIEKKCFKSEIFKEKPDAIYETEDIKTEDVEMKSEKEETKSPAESEIGLRQCSLEKKTIFQQRRPIITKLKERKDKVPSANAFSPDNESSVYAFEADSDVLPVSTPFRRHNRRSSSTATSKSEDEAVKIDEDLKKFRLPTAYKSNTVKSNMINEQQVSFTLTTDDGTNKCASIAVQVNLDTAEQVALDSNLECSAQTDVNDDGHLFYIPLQTNIESSTDQQVIQGVAVKLGTAGLNGPNQRVIMQAKLVTKASSNQATLPVARTILPTQQTRPSTSMYPPVGTVQPFRSKPSEIVKPMTRPDVRTISEHSTSSEDTKFDKYKSVPTSPSASSSSSSKINKRPVKLKPRALETYLSTNTTKFPHPTEPSKMVEAPVFHPTEKEFQDPLEYIDKIRPLAESFGLCRIVPPAGFKPECKVSDDMRFTAYNQYVHKMLHRWGPNFRELTAIKKYLATQNITLAQAPWIGGMEVDLPRLYQTVQSLGGLKEVIEKKRWPRVAEIMRIPKSAQDRLTKLDDIYCKYLLPYDTLSPAEREKLLKDVDAEWEKRNSLKNSQSEDSETEPDDIESTECIVRGRGMPLNSFYRIARNTMSMWFKSPEPTVSDVETEFWKHVKARTHHLCVNSGSIDSSGYGYGFVCSKNSPFARHPWNLKVLTNNSNSILRSMGPIMGVTVPTIHVGMVFSACCWYRDPHCLPWIEYLHTGASKVWYGIPDTYHVSFRKTLNEIVPRLCRKTSVWLPSDTAMIPPSLLVGKNVSLCRTVQEPGQYIIVFPKAFTSSLCTGYTVSESVFFARSSWLDEAETIFKELRESSEPSMFSLERLLLSIATDTRCSLDVFKKILPGVRNIIEKEHGDRKRLSDLGLVVEERLPQSNKKKKKADTDGEYLCEVCRSNLYVSLVAEAQDDGVYCLQHAAEYVESEKILVKNCKLMYTYTEDELNDMIDKLVSSIDVKSLKKLGK